MVFNDQTNNHYHALNFLIEINDIYVGVPDSKMYFVRSIIGKPDSLVNVPLNISARQFLFDNFIKVL